MHLFVIMNVDLLQMSTCSLTDLSPLEHITDRVIGNRFE